MEDMNAVKEFGEIDLHVKIRPKKGYRFSDSGLCIAGEGIGVGDLQLVDAMSIVEDVAGMIDRTVDPADLLWEVFDVSETPRQALDHVRG